MTILSRIKSIFDKVTQKQSQPLDKNKFNQRNEKIVDYLENDVRYSWNESI